MLPGGIRSAEGMLTEISSGAEIQGGKGWRFPHLAESFDSHFNIGGLPSAAV